MDLEAANQSKDGGVPLPLGNADSSLLSGIDRGKLLEAVLASVDDFAFLINPQGKLLYVNRGKFGLGGKTWDATPGKTFAQIGLPEEVTNRIESQLQEVIRTGRAVEREFRNTNRNDVTEVHRVRMQPILEQGTIKVVSGTLHSREERTGGQTGLTELAAEKEAQARLFDATLASINDLAYTFDLEGNWTYANKPLLELWGRSLEEIVGKSSLELNYPPELAERLKQQVKQVVATRKPLKGETFFTSGAGVVDYHEYIFSPVFAPDGSVAAVCGTTRLITERKRAEEQLRLRSERMQLLSETLGQLLSARDPETVVIELFPRVAAHLGVDTYFNFMLNKHGDALDLHSCAGVDPEIAQTFKRLELGQAICGTVAQIREPIVANDIQNSDYEKAALVRRLGIQTYACNPLMVGERLLGTLSFASRTRKSFDEDELKFIQIIAQYTAIAVDRMQTTLALRNSATQISEIINRSPVGIYMVDAKMRIQHVNPRAEPLFGAVANLIGSDFKKALSHIWPAAVVNPVLKAFQRTLETGDSYSQSGFAVSRADSAAKEFYDWEIHRLTLPDGQYGVVCYFVDVTPHMMAQLKIQESAEQLRLALSAGNLGMWSWDAETDEMSISQRTAEIYGVDANTVATRTELRKLLADEDQERARLALARSIETKTDYDIEYRVKAPNNSFLWVAAKGKATYGEDGRLQGMLGVVQDITERKNNEAALRESNERLESRVAERTAKLQETIADVESFSYSISHDLRAPLRAMQSFALILESDCGPQIDDAGRDYIRRIVRSADRMDRLIQDILVFSKVARGEFEMERVDLNLLLRGILESYPQFDSTKADIEVPESLPPVLANEAALTQCFSNLIGNAIKFVPPGTKPHVQIRASENGKFIRVSVQDNGIGIPKEAHERIFEIFLKLNKTADGTGIGLAIVKKAVDRMGGRVGLESAPGSGSTFWLDLKNPANQGVA